MACAVVFNSMIIRESPFHNNSMCTLTERNRSYSTVIGLHTLQLEEMAKRQRKRGVWRKGRKTSRENKGHIVQHSL